LKRRDFLKTAGVVAAGSLVARDFIMGKGLLSNYLISEKKPNIIFILVDDLGIGEVSCYGADNYKTPNIDKLAQTGVRFTHCYTPALCGPSRATILTGRYAFHTGATNQDSTGQMDPRVEVMIPALLKPAGYITASIGKWGQLPLTPHDFGFDDYLQFKGSGIYWNTQKKGHEYTVNGKTLTLHDKEYMPDVMHDYLVDFITKHRDDHFFVYYPMSHVHTEILPTPDSAPDSKDIYADNINYMDKLIGKLVNELEHLKIRDNTLIVFFSDNGTAGGHADRATIGGRRLIGQKGTMTEGGNIEPMIVNWPGITAPGTVNDDMIDSTDFLPTLVDIAGAKLPDNKFYDGHSFNDQIHGKKGNPRDWIYMQLGSKWYVRSSNWKLNQAGELFDMSKAPFEEILVDADTNDPEAIKARKKLQSALDQLNPAGGILDQGNGNGRHASKENKKNKKNNSKVKKNKDDD